MLELYHNINSVCAQKVRIALNEKGQQAKEHLLTLRGDQNEPAYLKLNPNGVVPTLVHDGNVIVESTVIMHYLDDVFPAPPLMPRAPLDRTRAHLFKKLMDEYIHPACVVKWWERIKSRPSYETAITKWLRPQDIARYEKLTDPWTDVSKNLAVDG